MNDEKLDTLRSAIGGMVKECRKRCGLTLAECADQAGVSGTMISKIERGAVTASLTTLVALADVFKVPVANFFSGTVEKREVSFVPAGQGMEVKRKGSTYGYEYRMIGRAVSGQSKTEAFIVTIEAAPNGQPMFMDHGIEFIHVIEGAMTYKIGDDQYELRSGDSLTFDASAPHSPAELLTRNVRFFYVTTELQ